MGFAFAAQLIDEQDYPHLPFSLSGSLKICAARSTS